MHEHHAGAGSKNSAASPGAESEANEAEAEAASETGTARFSVSLPGHLLRDFDAMVHAKGYANRSLAVADMIREQLVQHRQGFDEQEIAGTITFVYDHHKRNLQSSLTELQHENTDVIVSTLHVHLDHDNCLEVLVVRGPSAKIRKMAEALLAAKGVTHGSFTVATTSRDLAS